jgi:acyl-CoA thioesterase
MSKLCVPEETLKEEGAHQFEMEGWIDTAPFERLLNMEIRTAEKGEAYLAMPFTVKLSQGGGLLHGGALTALADTAVAMAMKSLLPQGTAFATTELTMKFLAPVRKGEVRAKARVEGPKGRTLLGYAVVSDEEDSSVAEFKATFRIARGQGYFD